MNAVLNTNVGDLIETDEFFAPVAYTAIDSLLGQYSTKREQIEALAAMMDKDRLGIVRYFHDGNKDRQDRMPDPDVLFRLDGALAALNADFWQRALNMTDVYDCMPVKRRQEWDESIRNMTTPEFTEENVTATFETLLAARSRFLAERVDGIFQGLSGTHVTNSPAAFGERMIMDCVFGYYSYRTPKAELINDLRCVIAKFMGRDEPKYGQSRKVLDAIREDHGQWYSVDGGALRIRCYLKGTAHMEVHEDMAWRLNAILHSLYPLAIPASFRTPPKRKGRTHTPMQRPLPFAVLAVLEDLDGRGCSRSMRGYGSHSKFAMREARQVIESLGGVQDGDYGFSFSYDPTDVLREVIVSGCVPDRASHQYYPTPETVARAAVDMAEIGPDDTCLEPSAGTGHIATLLPAEHTQCVEIAPLHCKVLSAKGYQVHQRDFLAWAAEQRGTVTRVVMNPPYADGQYMAHVEAAATLLAPGGILVAIVPASQRGKDLVPGLESDWSDIFANVFAGTSMDVAIYRGRKL